MTAPTLTDSKLKELFFQFKSPGDFGGRSDDHTVASAVRIMRASIAADRAATAPEPTRKDAEQWYTINAFDYVSAPVGSREAVFGGMTQMEQLRLFVEFEKRSTGKTHIAQWALEEIERLLHSNNAKIDWAVARWDAEVKNRPLVNVHRRMLDDTWRQVIRFFGGDPDVLVGAAHDNLVLAQPHIVEALK